MWVFWKKVHLNAEYYPRGLEGQGEGRTERDGITGTKTQLEVMSSNFLWHDGVARVHNTLAFILRITQGEEHEGCEHNVMAKKIPYCIWSVHIIYMY
jgi:hypothetical protein